MRDILGQLQGLYKDITDYFNPVGRAYLQYQLIFRVMFVNILLSDIFGGWKLICDTQQVGCQEMCINRFAPISFKKLWELELWFVLIVECIYIIFMYLNASVEAVIENPDHKNKNSKRLEKMAGIRRYEVVDGKKRRIERGDEIRKTDNKVVVYSRFTSIGYFIMLVVRILVEIYFLHIEYQLAIHQTGKTGIEAFELPEKYHCRTHQMKEIDGQSANEPDGEKSSVFYINEPLEACSQQRYEVVCWIPNSRMKTKGLYFMYMVLIVSTLLSVVELIWLASTSCCGTSKKKQALRQQIVDLKHQNSTYGELMHESGDLTNRTNGSTAKYDIEAPAPLQ